MRDFVNLVWRVLGKVASPTVMKVDGEPADEYWIGSDAIRWLAADRTRRLRDRSTQNYYRPRPTGGAD
jgi:hypothetical protein